MELRTNRLDLNNRSMIPINGGNNSVQKLEILDIKESTYLKFKLQRREQPDVNYIAIC